MLLGCDSHPRSAPVPRRNKRRVQSFGGAEEPEVQHPQLHLCSRHRSLGQGLLVASQPILDIPNMFNIPGSPRGSAVPLPSPEPGAEPARAARAALPSPHSAAHTPRVCIIPGHKQMPLSVPTSLGCCCSCTGCPEPPGTSPCAGTCLCCRLCSALLCRWVGASGCREQRRGFHTSYLVI